MNRTNDFYQKHLNKVSRSFAACISQLEQPLRRYVSLTYLVCRVLDSVEDARWSRLSQQLRAFRLFDDLLKDPKLLRRLDFHRVPLPEGLTPGEQALVKEAGSLFSDLHESPAPVRHSIQSLVKSMSAGMQYFAQKRAGGGLRLKGLDEVNQYCFFVAGLVGETLAALLAAVDPRVEFRRDLVLKAHHFGLFLQKVNLLKDQYRDEGEGRFLVPERELVYASLKDNAEQAWLYISSLPLEQKGYRVFCLWSLFLGLRTLPLLRQQAVDDLEPKLSREETLLLFRRLEDMASNPSALDEMFHQSMQQNFQGIEPVATRDGGGLASTSPWFTKYYEGLLTLPDFTCLGMVPGSSAAARG